MNDLPAPLWRRLLEHRLAIWAMAACGCALVLPAIDSGFQMDDLFHRLRLLTRGGLDLEVFVPYPGDPVSHREMLENGSLPWWVAPEFRHANLRVLSALSMSVDYALWPHSPAAMHVHNIVWLGAMILAVGFAYGRMLAPVWVAGIATLLFALDDAHALPTAYIANRNALMATAFGALSLAFLARRSATGWAPRPIASASMLALALASGEIALGIVGYLIGFVAFVERGPWRQRVSAIAPSALVLIGWVAVYVAGGFGSRGSGFYLDPVGNPVAFAKALATRVPALLLGQWTPIPADWSFADDPFVRGVFAVGGPALVVALLLGLRRLVAADPAARCFAFGMTTALVPIAAAGPQNRLLCFVGIGAMGLIAQLVERAFTPQARPFARAVVIALLAIHTVLAAVAAPFAVRSQAGSGEAIRLAVASIPETRALASQSLVVVNGADHVYFVSSIPVLRLLEGGTPPARIRSLSPGGAIELERTDAATLVAQFPEGAFTESFGRFFRDPSLPVRLGERVETSDLEVEVLAVERGEPTRVRFRFRYALEHSSLRFVRFDDGRFRPWALPAVGERVRVPAAASLFADAD